jgi:hypothetical protein
MFSKLVTKALVPALLIGASGAVSLPTAHAASPQTCVFEKYAPVSVEPYSADEIVSYGSYSFLRGAQLYVPAREGLTKEWLEASVQQALAQQDDAAANKSTDPACQSPHVKNVKVTVTSAGNGFWVALIGRDERAANILLKWARSIVDQHKQPARTAASAH